MTKKDFYPFIFTFTFNGRNRSYELENQSLI
jgi:hypothetical protein